MQVNMKNRYRLIRRNERRHKFYCFDVVTGKRVSLHTQSEDEAAQIVLARNQALRQPALNLQIAKAYLSGTDSGVATRTWATALGSLIDTKQGENRLRWERAAKDGALRELLPCVVIETPAETILQALKSGSVSTNVFLRRLHNFCVAMNWLPWPIVPKPQWPAVRFKEKRAITLEEHQRILARETNSERRAFYELCWHFGGSQTDIASLSTENVDWEQRTIGYGRSKTGSVAGLRFSANVETLLRSLPQSGPFFPYLMDVRSSDRATEFKQRCAGLAIRGVTLHSYRYAWAERARVCGYPERFAQEALGHNSKAVHRAYAKKAQVTLPSLDDYERQHAAGKIITIPMADTLVDAAVIAP